MGEGEASLDSARETLSETETDASLSNGGSRARRTGTHGRDGLDFARGEAIGRYLVLHRLGAGGMGVVYAAYDPELDRRVAVKLLRADALGSTRSTVGEARLKREARAMAKLAAPNVVTVFDIGMVGDQVYVAMEFVDGGTLADWLTPGRGWREVVDVFRKAGTGLAAVHVAGLVHRDFKPENVMLSRDGRVLVMDFGLVREHDEASRVDVVGVAGEAEAETTLSEQIQLTRAGSIMGTLAYMAPEQHLGLATDARTDQFSFCVAMYEALYGERPFRGDTPAVLAFQVTEGNVGPAPKGRMVPAWLRRALLRGLANRREDRYSSMEELLSEIDRDPARTRRLWVGSAAGGLLVATVAFNLPDGSAASQPCSGAEQQLVGVWDDDAKAAARAAFEATEVVYAADTWTRVERLVDGYGASWVAAHVDACEATHVRKEQSAELLDRRMACLDRRRLAVDALAEVYADANEALIANAVAAAEKLPPLEPCADPNYLLAEVPPPEDEATRTSVEELRAELVEAHVLEATGRYDAGLAIAVPAWDRAKELAYRPLEAEAALLVGLLRRDLGEYERAQAALEAATWAGRASRDDRTAAAAAVELAGVVGASLKQPGPARLWIDVGAAEVERLADDYLAARLAGQRGLVADEVGDYAAAQQAYADELELLEKLGRQSTLDGAVVRNNQGSAAYAAGEYAQAAEFYQAALDIDRSELGELHPAAATVLGNLGLVARAQGELARARELQGEALALKEKVLPADHPSLAHSLDNLGTLWLDAGEPARAGEQFVRSLEIRRKAFGADHVETAQSLLLLGVALRRAGDLDAALARAQEGVALIEDHYGAEHPKLAGHLDELGLTLLAAGELESSRAQLERAVALREATQGADHPNLAASLLGLGRVLLAQHEGTRPVEVLRRASKLAQQAGGRGELRGELQFELAKALAAVRGDAVEIDELAQTARAIFKGQGREHDAAEVSAWIAGRPAAAAPR